MMEISGDDIAEVALKQFAGWEKKRKPLTRTNGVKEWVPFSGIVVQGTSSRSHLKIFTNEDREKQ